MILYTKEVYEEAGIVPYKSTYRSVVTGKILQKQEGDLRLSLAFCRLINERVGQSFHN